MGWNVHMMTSYLLMMTFLTNGIQTLQHRWKKCVICSHSLWVSWSVHEIMNRLLYLGAIMYMCIAMSMFLWVCMWIGVVCMYVCMYVCACKCVGTQIASLSMDVCLKRIAKQGQQILIDDKIGREGFLERGERINSFMSFINSNLWHQYGQKIRVSFF